MADIKMIINNIGDDDAIGRCLVTMVSLVN